MEQLDPLDRAIIDALRQDARLSARAIARQLGVAPGTISQRIIRLEGTGTIRGYRAVVDPTLDGRTLGFVVGVQIAPGMPLGEVLDELVGLAEVDEVKVVTGRWDLLVIGRVADPASLNVLLTEELWQSPSFRHSETMVVINERSAARRADQ